MLYLQYRSLLMYLFNPSAATPQYKFQGAGEKKQTIDAV